jgi:hypothetical protein
MERKRGGSGENRGGERIRDEGRGRRKREKEKVRESKMEK